MVSRDLIHAWEDAYCWYGVASGAEIAPASRAVALAWRDLVCTSTLPWWVLAAVESAAQAFEDQADELDERAPEVPELAEIAGGVPAARKPGDRPIPRARGRASSSVLGEASLR